MSSSEENTTTSSAPLFTRGASVPVLRSQEVQRIDDDSESARALSRANTTRDLHSRSEHSRADALVNGTVESIRRTQQNIAETMRRAQEAIESARGFETKWKQFQDRFDKIFVASLEQIRKGMLADDQRGYAAEDALSETQKFGVLEGRDPNLPAFARVLKTKKKVVVVMGAGCSTAAGIPDFRSPGTGLYATLKSEECPQPEVIFNIEYFKTNPAPFNTRAKVLWPGQHQPTRAHRFLKELEEKDMLLRCYTQNIDGLEFIAGVSADKVMQCHGGFSSARCSVCKKEAEIEKVKEVIMADGTPTCSACSGFIKPDIVFFGEEMPQKFREMYEKDFREADALIVMGTSLQVRPVSLLPTMVRADVPRLLINKEVVGPFDRPPARRNYRDVTVVGECDDGVSLLAAELGWDVA